MSPKTRLVVLATLILLGAGLWWVVGSEPKAKFGDSAKTIISRLKAGKPLDVEEEWAYDFISELIRSDCTTAHQAYGWATRGSAPSRILRSSVQK